MDGGSHKPKTTAGLDLGDKYSYLCLIDQQSGEIVEEGGLRTRPEAFRRRFAFERPMRIAFASRAWVNVTATRCRRSAPVKYLTVCLSNPRIRL